MPPRRKTSRRGPQAILVLLAVAALVAAVLLLARGGGLGRQPRESSARPDFGEVLEQVAARRGAERQQVTADDPIRKVGGVFVRSWRVELPNEAARDGFVQDVQAEAARWPGAEARLAQGQLEIDLGSERFLVDVQLAPPARMAQIAPLPTPRPDAPTPRPAPTPTLPADARGRLAILLDDAGQSLDLLDAAATLPDAVGVAVLPFLPHSVHAAAAMHNAGHEVWLHLPMEPQPGSGNPGTGAILASMSEDEVRLRVRSALNNVPHIVGVNNHMGSRATASLRTMTWMMQELSPRGLGFIDSRTTAATVAEDAARAQGVPVGRRRVFLDNERSAAAIRRQLAEAVYAARRYGEAIAIGHLQPTTVSVLAAELPGLAERGADLVPPSELVH